MANKSILEVKRFVDQDGREVHQYKEIIATGNKELFYKGKVPVRINPVGPNGQPGQPQTIPFEFLFPEGTDLKTAFDTFDTTAKQQVDEHAKKMMEQQKEKKAASKVVPIKSMPSILGADGRPMG